MSDPQQTGAVRSILSAQTLPWLLFVFLCLILMVSMPIVYWRGSGVGPQVQVPMFYDAHYLFPRPWTQEQAAPGVPDPAPIAFYGENQIHQSFVAGADRLAMLSLWIAGPKDSPVFFTVAAEDGRQWTGKLLLSAGQAGKNYRLSLPAAADSAGREYTLTLTAPEATAEHPVTALTVGGDRFGQTLRLNEFVRPGNLALMTYSKGWPGRWWFDALAEQILPSVFRLRLQQYKPPVFKGPLFSWLLGLTAILSVLMLILSSPMRQANRIGLVRNLGWALAIFLGGLLFWQFLDGRAVVSGDVTGLTALAAAKDHAETTIEPGEPRIMIDLASDLWTAVREPEARFITTEVLQGLPAIKVPGGSRIDYALIVPPASRVRLAQAVQGEGEVQFDVKIGDDVIDQALVLPKPEPAPGALGWKELDLGAWAGKGVTLSLETFAADFSVQGIWIMPQIITDRPWLLPDLPASKPDLSVGAVYDGALELIGLDVTREDSDADDKLVVQLLWRPISTTDRSGKVFVHLLDSSNQLMAQHDGFPVSGSYPTTIWQQGTIVLDAHSLSLDNEVSAGPYRLAIGVYDPDTLERWATTDTDGTLIQDGRAIIDLPAEVLP